MRIATAGERLAVKRPASNPLRASRTGRGSAISRSANENGVGPLGCERIRNVHGLKQTPTPVPQLPSLNSHPSTVGARYHRGRNWVPPSTTCELTCNPQPCTRQDTPILALRSSRSNCMCRHWECRHWECRHLALGVSALGVSTLGDVGTGNDGTEARLNWLIHDVMIPA